MTESLEDAIQSPDASTVDLPENLPDEFHDAWRTEVKRRIDAQTALRNRQPEAPASYELHLAPEVRDAFMQGDDDPLLAAFTEGAREARLSQAQFDRIVAGYEAVAQQVLADRLTPAKLRAALEETYGDRTDKTIQSVSNFLTAAVPDPELREVAVQLALSSPEAFRVYDALRKLVRERSVPAEPGRQTPAPTPHEELHALVHSDAYRTGDREALRRANDLVRLAETAEAAGE